MQLAYNSTLITYDIEKILQSFVPCAICKKERTYLIPWADTTGQNIVYFYGRSSTFTLHALRKRYSSFNLIDVPQMTNNAITQKPLIFSAQHWLK